ncbi:hypothetical protein ILUMI_22231 [Ignelater luminosus]|uniref:Uncharacterized protein n=1 Tax=Ignelater luminosus TaxID=2038154 RepID=A0A8K0CD53_IGNLU|nr:hypothetical protein ILUMI_22231 [Ignelater luminosus]
MSLKEIRYGIFSTALVKKEFNLASLPPTEATAPSILFEPTCRSKCGKTTDKAAAPEELINSMFCKSTKGYHGCQSCKNSPTDDELITNCCAPIDDEAEEILAIQKSGEVVEKQETDEEDDDTDARIIHKTIIATGNMLPALVPNGIDTEISHEEFSFISKLDIRTVLSMLLLATTGEKSQLPKAYSGW